MSEKPDSPSALASLCFNPTPAPTTELPPTDAEPLIPASTDAHAETPTMGNQQSGEGSLRRRLKKKSKNKDEKTKVGIASALFSDPVLGASGVGPYAGSSVDEAVTPSKRKKQTEQTKSPRPIRSTYDNVNQSGSITSLCDASEMYTSDLFLDTVSRLDVSMTTSQPEMGGLRHHFDPQALDNLSYGDSSLAESGFITPALTTPQVQRNKSACAMTTSDSVTELGKEIERTIFERLSANQKAGNTEAHPEAASLSSSPKPNEHKVTMVVQSPIPPRKTVTEVRLATASPRTAKLEMIRIDSDECDSDIERSEPKSLKPFNDALKLKMNPNEINQPRAEKAVEISDVNDGTDKADNEPMEKECQQNELKKDAEIKANADSTAKSETKEKSEESDANVTWSSSDENYGDFEKVKLHIEEDDFVVLSSEGEKCISTNIDVEASNHLDIEPGQSTTTADHNPGPSLIAAGQQSALTTENVPKESEETISEEKPADKESYDKNTVGIHVNTEVSSTENTNKIDVVQETIEKSESVLISQIPRMESSGETASLIATDVAAAVVATKPLEDTAETVAPLQASVQTDESFVGTPEAVCEQVIQATDFACVEQANVMIRRPFIEADQEFHDSKNQAEIERVEKKTGLIQKPNYEPEIEPKLEINGNKIVQEDNHDIAKSKTEKKNERVRTKSISRGKEDILAKDKGLEKERSLSESEKVVICSSETDDIRTKRNMEHPPKEVPTVENSHAEVTIKSSKSKKDRKRKRRKSKQQLSDASDATKVEAERDETSGIEDVSLRLGDNATVSSREEETEKSTADESGDSSATAFEKHSLEHQTTIIERPGYQKHDSEKREETCGKPIDACDLLLQSDEFKNQEPCKQGTPETVCTVQLKDTSRVAIDTNLTVESPASSEILSDDPTPTDDRSSQLRSFYIRDRSQISRTKNENAKTDEPENIIVGQVQPDDEIEKQKDCYQKSSDSQIKQSSSSSIVEEKNKNGEGESTIEDVATNCPDGTNTKKAQKRSLRISLTSEEVSEIFMNGQTRLDNESHFNSKLTSQESESIITGSDRKSDTEEDPSSENYRSKHEKNISNLTLSDIDSSLPETLPELADLQNFLEYIKVGERPAGIDTPPFSPRAETGRSSPNENSNSRRLSRISPAITDRSITESDLDISEQRDDLSTDSNIFADDEDESSSELLFTKTYTEPDQGGEVCVSCTVVNTNADDDSDEFWAENSASEEVYQRIETSTKAVTTVFDNARLQMQDIHTHLHNLRLQMESLQDSLDNACILSQEYYHVDNDQITSQDYYSADKGFVVSQEYFSRNRNVPVTTEEYSPVDIGPVLTEEYYSSTLGKPPLL